MATQPTRHTVIVLDRSGSMSPIAGDVVAGVNDLLLGLRAADPTSRLTLVQFDDEDPFEITVDAGRVAQLPLITPDRYQPRGSTPLYDALGWTFDHLAGRAARRSDMGLEPEDVELVVITDGMENASRRWSARDIAGRIRRRKAAGWRFRYLGANQDAWSEGGRIGIDRRDISEFAADSHGTRAMFTGLTSHLTQRPARAARRHPRPGPRHR